MTQYTDNTQKIYIQYSHDIDFDYSTGKYPDGTESSWDWEESYIPIEHHINGKLVGKHVFMKIKVGFDSFWTSPIALSANITNIDTVVGEIHDDGVSFSFIIKLTFTDGTTVQSEPITIKNGVDGTKIESAVVNAEGYLIMTYDDGTIINAGYVKGDDGGGVGSTFTNPEPTPATIGGISAGSTFDDATMQEMWDGLLYPYQVPTFSSFSIASQNVNLEVGEDVVGGMRTFNWATSNPENIEINSISVLDVTGGNTVLGAGMSNDGTENLNIGLAISKNTNTNHQWRISAINTNAGILSRNFNVDWYWRLYYGESNNSVLNEAEVEGLGSDILTNSISRNYSFLAGGYKYISHEESLGTLTSFVDTDTGFAVPFEAFYILSITNSNGVSSNYKIYRSTYQLGSSISIAAN